MQSISVLDCTLRDGGYVNEWKFGYNEKLEITAALVKSGVDILECGFLSETKKNGDDLTTYKDIGEIKKTLPDDMGKSIPVCMVNYGELNPDNLPYVDEDGVKGIRLAFHKKNLVEAMEVAKKIKEKGYLLFIQPMVSLNYSDIEFIELIKKSNDIQPYAFYIVDSFGTMQRKDVIRLFYLIENNLSEKIKIGFHSHNNLQMAFLNAQALIDIDSQRHLIVDSSIHGMGRGAGNLNTELLFHFLNENYKKQYDIYPLLEVEDSVIQKIYVERNWGYSIPNYLSAISLCHPNYALTLDDKKTLTVDDMARIFSMMDQEKKSEFDKKYLEELYQKYMISNQKKFDKNMDALIEKVKGKTIFIIAAGKSIIEAEREIFEYINKDEVVSFSVNFKYEKVDTDYIFVGNRRRYLELQFPINEELVLTTNIDSIIECYRVDYNQVINDNEIVRDNSGLMLIKFLINSGAQKIVIAGMDGYSHDLDMNFASDKMKTYSRKDYADSMNAGMREVINNYKNEIVIEFLTSSTLN